MPLKRGTLVAISNAYGDHVDGVGGTYWLEGRVGSRRINGWVKVKVFITGDLIVVRNNPKYIVKLPPKRGTRDWILIIADPAAITINRFARGMLARINSRKLVQTGKTLDQGLALLDKATEVTLNAYWDQIVQETISASNQNNSGDDIDSLSEIDDEIEIVDPPDDAYGNLTTEQQKIIRRLIGEFTKMNKSTGNI